MAQKPITATNPKTGEKMILQNGQWVSAGGPVGAPAPKLTNPDRKVLNDLNNAAATAREVKQQYSDVIPVIKRFQPGPVRGALMDALTPQDGGWNILPNTIGAVARGVGAISPQDTRDFQTLKAIQSRRVLAEQTLQKGVQTEGDAARIKAGDIGPYMDAETNMATAKRGVGVADRSQARAKFYTDWANTVGLNNPGPDGLGVEAAFQKSIGEAGGAPAKGPVIKRIQ